MLFTCYGDIQKPAVLLMHGMCQDWHSLYDCLGSLQKQYYLIVPAMDGFYDGSGEWTSFPDQCRQIEEYVNAHHGGKLYGIYGASQGTIVLSELLARNKITVEKAFFDGTYVAHQGVFSAKCTYGMFSKAKKHNGNFPKSMLIMMHLMGLSEKDMVMLRYVYWDASDESMWNNMKENYTYHVNPAIAETKTELTLCCGSKEPYAKKSHRILKKYLPDCHEIILKGYGHGQMVYQHGNELAQLICDSWEKKGEIL